MARSGAEILVDTVIAFGVDTEATDGSTLVGAAIAALGPRGTRAMVEGANITTTVKFNHPDMPSRASMTSAWAAVDDSDAGSSIKAVLRMAH